MPSFDHARHAARTPITDTAPPRNTPATGHLPPCDHAPPRTRPQSQGEDGPDRHATTPQNRHDPETTPPRSNIHHGSTPENGRPQKWIRPRMQTASQAETRMRAAAYTAEPIYEQPHIKPLQRQDGFPRETPFAGSRPIRISNSISANALPMNALAGSPAEGSAILQTRPHADQKTAGIWPQMQSQPVNATSKCPPPYP